MKKIITIIFVLSICVLATAEMNPSNRTVEFGVAADVGLSSNYFALDELLTKEIVFDFNDMAKSLDGNDFRLDAIIGADVFFNLKVKQKFQLGLFVNVDVDGYAALPNALINFVANGNKLDEKILGDFGVGASAYATIGASFGSSIRKIAFKITPEYFMPIVYIPRPDSAFSARLKSNGGVTADAHATIKMYTPFSLENGLSNFDASSLFSSGGLDLTMEAEYPLFSFLDIGVKVSNLPLKPATLTSVAKISVSASAKIKDGGFIGYYTSETETEENVVTTEKTVSEVEYGEEETSVYRPFKLSFLAAWRPFKTRILTLKPILAFKFNDPTAIDTGIFNAEGFDMEFGVNVETLLLKVFGFSLNMYREDSVWKQQFGASMNLKIFEVDVVIGGQSSEFLQAFSGKGISGGVCVKVGF